MPKNRTTGLTKDSGYQVGIRRTINLQVREVWKFLLSKQGMGIWLGTWEFDKWETGIEYFTKEGISGNIRVFKVFSHIRLSWRHKSWNNNTILQIRTIPHSGKTTLSFHQEKLFDARQREEMKQHWTRVLEELIEKLKKK